MLDILGVVLFMLLWTVIAYEIGSSGLPPEMGWWRGPVAVVVGFFLTAWVLYVCKWWRERWKEWTAEAQVRRREKDERREAEEEGKAHRAPLLDKIASAHGRYLRVMEEARKGRSHSSVKTNTSDEKEKKPRLT